MPPLLQVDPARQALEVRRATLAEESEATWRRAWLAVYAQCMGCFVLGYILYGVAWGMTGRAQAGVVLTASMLVSYLLPLWRLLAFFLRHGDQF